MPNFHTDNPDIAFCLAGLDMDRAIALREGDFHEAREYDFAPRDAAEAKAQYEALLKLAGEITGDFVAPRAKAVDREGNRYQDGVVLLHPLLRESLERFRNADLMGLSIARRYGGLNVPQAVKTAAIEMVARADASLMNIVGLQDIAETIEEFGNETLKRESLPRLCAGQDTAAMVLTEPDAGSDLQAVRVRADPEGEAGGLWRLSGTKRFITNGCGEVLLVLARSEPGTTGGRGLSVFFVRKGEGVRIRRIEEKLGIHGSPTCEIQFHNAPGWLVGERKRGLIEVAMNIMNGARIGIAAQALGIAEAAERAAKAYARAREQFGKSIREFPAVYEMLAAMRLGIEAARALTYQSAHIVELLKNLQHREAEGQPLDAAQKTELKELTRLAAVLTPLAKYYATEMCNQTASDAIQVLGGSGYMRDYPVERHFRDARITNIYEGTTQLQVIGAIGGVRGVLFRKHVEEMLASAEKGAAADVAAEVRALVPSFDEALAAFSRQTDTAFLDLYARKLVDIALDVYLATLLALQAARAERKRAVARAFLVGARHRVRENLAIITEGSRVLIEQHRTIIEG